MKESIKLLRIDDPIATYPPQTCGGEAGRGGSKMVQPSSTLTMLRHEDLTSDIRTPTFIFARNSAFSRFSTSPQNVLQQVTSIDIPISTDDLEL